MTELVSLRLDPALRERLDELARVTQRSRASIAAEAVKQYVVTQEWQISAIRAGIDDADKGNLIDHAKLKAKWEKRLAAAVVKSR